MPEAVTHVGSGKVRELYALDDERLLLVASDRISTFDVVLPTEIPDKGRVLTGLSAFWFARTREIVAEPPARAAGRRPLDRVPPARDAADRVRRARLPGRVGLEGLPGDRLGLRARARRRAASSRTSSRSRSSRRRPRPTEGHDENIDRERAAELVGQERFDEVERVSLGLYRFASEYAAERGILIADTKFEFGLDPDGRLVLGDEAFTPDSSRFWPADEYEPGRAQPSFDKQFVRDYCETLGWDKTAPGPGAARGRRRRHARPLRRGVRAADRHRVRRLPRRPGRRARDEGDGARPAEARDPRPAGRGRPELAAPARLRGRRGPRRPRDRPRARRRATPTPPAPSSSGCASSCSPTR